MLHLTNPCAKRKVLSLTKPKGKIYKTKSLSHYITHGQIHVHHMATLVRYTKLEEKFSTYLHPPICAERVSLKQIKIFLECIKLFLLIYLLKFSYTWSLGTFPKGSTRKGNAEGGMSMCSPYKMTLMLFHNLITWPVLIQMISNFNSMCRNNSKFYVLWGVEYRNAICWKSKGAFKTLNIVYWVISTHDAKIWDRFEWELVKLLD